MSQSIRTVGVLGSGVIGASWASLFLAKGLKVIIADPAEGAREQFFKQVRNAWPALERLGLSEGASLFNYEFVDHISERTPELDFIQDV